MENGAERHEASSPVLFPRVTVSTPPPAAASRALIPPALLSDPKWSPRGPLPSSSPTPWSPRARSPLPAVPPPPSPSPRSAASSTRRRSRGQMGKIRTCTEFSTKDRVGVHKLEWQMVKPNGVLPKVALPILTRMVKIHRRMILLIRLVLDRQCIMVVETTTAVLEPCKPLNLPMNTRGTRRILPQILMATGGKDRFTTRESGGLSPGELGT